MHQVRIATCWAAAMLAAALAQRLGYIAADAGQALFFVLLIGAVTSVGLVSRRPSCQR